MSAQLGGLPDWHRGDREFTIGVEEEAFLLEPGSGEIAHRSAEVLPRLREALGEGVTTETTTPPSS